MNCYIHSDRSAIGTCVGCGKFICEECNTEVNNKNYCKKCVSELINENKKKIEKLEDSNNKQPNVYMNAGGGGGAASSSSSSSSSTAGGYQGPPIPLKSKVAAGILAIFLGGLGVHKFYLGQPILGLLYLLFSWTFIPAIIGFIEGIIYLSTSDEMFARKYGARYY